MLHYFEHVLIVIHQVADGVFGEYFWKTHLFWNQILSLGWAVQDS
jgi:hypothetical protein